VAVAPDEMAPEVVAPDEMAPDVVIVVQPDGSATFWKATVTGASWKFRAGEDVPVSESAARVAAAGMAAVGARAVTDTVKSVDASGAVRSAAHRDQLRELCGPWVVDAQTWQAVTSQAASTVPGAGTPRDFLGLVLAAGLDVVTVPAR
jgi:2-C-methyl-D-erythritol 4-phosphate cytidylyltransferase